MKYKTILLTLVSLLMLACNRAPKSVCTPDRQAGAVIALIGRVVGPEHAGAFEVNVTGVQKDGKDYFALYGHDGRIVLEGNDGVSAASALKYYLERYCNCQITWCGTNLDLPEELPVPADRTERTSPYKYRYYLNYCTFNYTMSWWDEARWQREIDFMALNGINMPLAVTGQNSVWQRVYRKLGFSDDDLKDFFSGPAYFNWFWMGNLDGWGGPLPQSFIDRHEELQRFILHGERALGMTPVLPAFTGHVPPAFVKKFPDAAVRKTSWVEFPEVCILDPDEELFTRIGSMFIEEQTRLYGTNHLYSADTFNENLPPTNDSLYLSQISRKVFDSMRASDPEATWVMQGWLFYHDREFWGEKEIEALLSAVPDEHMIVLDLWSERYPIWKQTNAYDGKQWIWCMLHNFGQNITFSGNARSVANDPAAALHDPAAGNMRGIGLTMEGIEQNPFIYALFLENVWRDTPVDLGTFVTEYTTRRYGKTSPTAIAAWNKMLPTLYENELTNGGNESIITGRPTLKRNPEGTTNIRLHYKNRTLVEAWDGMIACADTLAASDGFRYDLTDITRQVLANYASVLQQRFVEALGRHDREGFEQAAERFLALIGDLDTVLATRGEFLLGRWLRDARAMGTTPAESDLYEQNARNLLTTWGDKNCRIADYACRQWSGMMSGYYAPRWERFFEAIRAAGYTMDEAAYKDFAASSKEWEWQWTLGHESYPTEPSGDEIEACKAVHARYRAEMQCEEFLDNRDFTPTAGKELI